MAGLYNRPIDVLIEQGMTTVADLAAAQAPDVELWSLVDICPHEESRVLDALVDALRDENARARGLKAEVPTARDQVDALVARAWPWLRSARLIARDRTLEGVHLGPPISWPERAPRSGAAALADLRRVLPELRVARPVLTRTPSEAALLDEGAALLAALEAAERVADQALDDQMAATKARDAARDALVARLRQQDLWAKRVRLQAGRLPAGADRVVLRRTKPRKR